MSPQVLKRFIVLLFVASLAVATATMFYDSFVNRPPGDYETEKGDINLNARDYEKALEWFDKALAITPDHRGAMMGRAVVFIQTERYDLALADLDELIEILEGRDLSHDPTGRGALAAAYANRGIIKDRQGRYEAALEDYVQALRIDEGAVDGPGLIDKIVHDPRPSTVRKRARYLYEQLQLPESERLMRVPELDAKQRRYKP